MRSAVVLSLALIATIAAATPVPSFAQAYPVKPVKILVPAQPGGGLDLVGRTVADQLSRSMKQTFLVENVGGGGGVIASQQTARAAPDGYTLMVGYVGTHGTNPAVRKLPYDAIRDFTPIAMVGGTPNILTVHPSVPVNTLKELIDYAKKNAGKMNYAAGGIGTLNHLAVEQIKADAGFDAVAAQYRGIGPAIKDVLGGQAMMIMPGLAAALPHIKAGKLKPIAVTGLKRHALVPEVPTFEESGFKGYDGVQWYGIVGPAKMPDAIRDRLNAEIGQALATPALRERLSSEALEPMPMTPQEMAKWIEADIARWTAVAKARGIWLED